MTKIENSLLINVLSNLSPTIIYFRTSQTSQQDIKTLNILSVFFSALLKINTYEYFIELNEGNQLMADLLNIKTDTIMLINKEEFHRLEVNNLSIRKVQLFIDSKLNKQG